MTHRSTLIASLGALALSTACGPPPDPASLSNAAPPQTQGERLSPQQAARAVAAMEINVIEVSRLALHRADSDRIIGDAKLTLARHRELLAAWSRLCRRARLPVTNTMDSFGQELWSMLFHQGSQGFGAYWCIGGRTLQAHAAQVLRQARPLLPEPEFADQLGALEAAWSELPFAADP